MPTFHTADCPADSTISQWIKSSTNWKSAERRFEPELRVPGLAFDSAPVMRDINLLLEQVEPVHWRSQPPGALTGLSLSYDPDAPQQSWPVGSFGHPRYCKHSAEDYYRVPATELEFAPRGDYLDSLCFRRLLPQVDALPALGALFARFTMPVVRSTLRIIDGSALYPNSLNTSGYHIDAPPCEGLRINLCVAGSADFGLQYQKDSSVVLSEPGSGVVVNTDFMHRPWFRRTTSFRRVHLILELTPWLDYNAYADTWAPNEHCGRTHPYDMIKNGMAWI